MSIDNDILLLKGHEIHDLFTGQEQAILTAVRRAYQIHDKGDSTLPPSSFIRFPDMERERIIALPAYLGGDAPTAGIKWISSFPENLKKGIERASAILVLNSMDTGRPSAIMESSIISAKRTAASAALGAHQLWGATTPDVIGVVGCGLINYEIIRFLVAVYPEIKNLLLFDLSQERMEQFKEKCLGIKADLSIEMANDMEEVLASTKMVTFATTAVKPHISDISMSPAGSVFLHISLRDLTPDIILKADNVVDDIEHVLKAQTSVHLAEQEVGHHDFIRGTLGGIFNGNVPAADANKTHAIFSPFGMGVLDLALAQLAQNLAIEQKKGSHIDAFFAAPWLDRY